MLSLKFNDLDSFCEFLRRVGGSGSVHMSTQRGGIGRYLSEEYLSDEGLMQGGLTFYPEIRGHYVRVKAGPFPADAATLDKLASAGLVPNWWGNASRQRLADDARARLNPADAMGNVAWSEPLCSIDAAVDGLPHERCDTPTTVNGTPVRIGDRYAGATIDIRRGADGRPLYDIVAGSNLESAMSLIGAHDPSATPEQIVFSGAPFRGEYGGWTRDDILNAMRAGAGQRDALTTALVSRGKSPD